MAILLAGVTEGFAQLDFLEEHELDGHDTGMRPHYLIDFDDDGDIDIFGRSEGAIIIFENDGDMDYDPHIIPEDGYAYLADVFPVDLDDDGDLDVVTAAYRPNNELAWWEKLDYGSEEYKAEKKKILITTIAQLEKELPGISSQIETSDVATPFTTFRYTNNWKAALGFIMTKTLAADMVMKPQYVLPGLDNFYMIGQWVKGFGVPMAATAGKEVIQKICKANGMKFKTK